MDTILKTIENSIQGIKRAKKATPHLFPQWHRMNRAKEELEKAKLKYYFAKQLWKDL